MMAKYKKYEQLPWWLNNLNHNTLTPTQKEVLDLDYYCKKHGTKLSHKNAAALLHRGRHTVYTARRRLEELGLRTTEPAKGSFKLGHPINYQDEAEFLAQLEARAASLRRFKMKRKSLRETPPLGGVSLSEGKNEAGQRPPAGELSPHSPAGSSVQGGAANPPPTFADITRREKALFKVTFEGTIDKYRKLDYSEERSIRLALADAYQAVKKRRARKKAQ